MPFRNLILCKCFCTLLLAFLGTQVAFAQRYPFYNLNVENGLIQSQAMCLAQDHYGNLWVGTVGGLSRYDGKMFTNYSVRNGLPNNIVQSLAVDNKGHIWIGGPGAISEFDGKHYKHYLFQSIEHTGGSNVRDIHITDIGTVWCLTGTNVYSIAKGKTKQLTLPGDAMASALLPDSSGLLVGTATGTLYRYHSNKWDSLTIPVNPLFLKPPVITSIFKDRSGMLWLTSNEGLYKVDSGRIIVHRINDQPLYSLPSLSAMTEDNNGNYWLAANNGVIRISGNNIQYYNKHNGLTDNIVSDILCDAEGNIWMATDGQGIFHFSGTQFTGLDESMGLQSSQVFALARDHARLYLGTYDGGLYSFQDGVVAPIPFPDKPNPTITSLCATRDGRLWIGTRGRGLWRYDNTFRQYQAPDRHFPSNFVTALYTDTSHNLYIGFTNGALFLEKDTFKTIPDIHGPVSSFLSIGKDSVLIATESGLKVFAAQSVIPFKTNTIADSATPQCIALRGRELWIGTSDNGVICYNLDTHHAFTLNKANGLQSDFIYSIIVDNDANIWLGTGYGIHKISRGASGQPVVTFYGKGQGITGMESNQNAIVKMPDGGIWFGTTNGALHYQPHALVNTAQPISIALQSIKVLGESLNDTTYADSTDNWYGVPYNLHLPYQKNNITFNFQAITLTGSQQLLYRYRIDGLDAPWSDWSATNSVTYSALPPGKYVFRVACMSAGNDQQTRELSYAFEIITPFQKTAWFRLAIFAACVLLGITLQYMANYSKERRRHLLARLRAEEQAKIRMRTAEDFHDEVGNKLTRINVLTNVLRSKIGEVTPDTKRILDQIEDNTGQLYSGTRDILWSLTPTNDNLYEILTRIHHFGTELFQDTEIDFIFEGTDEKWRNYRLPLDVSRNLIMICKEALNNTLKYAKATKVTLSIKLKRNDVLQLVLRDNGTGFDLRNVKKGHGINNMNLRAERMKGRLYIDSRPNKGTITNLTFKIPSNR